jgi:ubiquinone/menaquinone biosynthesis C-methylase UbiE
MEPAVKSSMFGYYEAHANDYDRVYSGQFPGSERVGADAYPADTAALRDVVAQACTGTLLDIPCGTAFWLPAYASRVERAVLLDQSHGMLARARARAAELGIESKCEFVRGDALSQNWDAESFDSLLVAFFLSHTDETDEEAFFSRARRGLKRSGRLIILDSSWNVQRSHSAPREAVIERSSTDGRRFNVYKRYFDAPDISRMAERHGFRASVLYTGRAFIAALATLVE